MLISNAFSRFPYLSIFHTTIPHIVKIEGCAAIPELLDINDRTAEQGKMGFFGTKTEKVKYSTSPNNSRDLFTDLEKKDLVRDNYHSQTIHLNLTSIIPDLQKKEFGSCA